MTRDSERDRELEALLERMGAAGRLPVREDTLERAWSRIDPARLSPTFRAQVHAALDKFAVPSERRHVGAGFASMRAAANFRVDELSRRLGVTVADLEGLEAGRTHPAAFTPGFWTAFADALSTPRRELARTLASTAALVAGTFTPSTSAGWAADQDTDMDTSPAEAEAALRERLAAIVSELERE